MKLAVKIVKHNHSFDCTDSVKIANFHQARTEKQRLTTVNPITLPICVLPACLNQFTHVDTCTAWHHLRHIFLILTQSFYI